MAKIKVPLMNEANGNPVSYVVPADTYLMLCQEVIQKVVPEGEEKAGRSSITFKFIILDNKTEELEEAYHDFKFNHTIFFPAEHELEHSNMAMWNAGSANTAQMIFKGFNGGKASKAESFDDGKIVDQKAWVKVRIVKSKNPLYPDDSNGIQKVEVYKED